jgi:plasmid stabilization system protein ParE
VDFKIPYTDPALADLEAFMHWSWGHHAESAEQFGMSLMDHIKILASLPFLGGRVSGRKDVRKLLHSPIRIYYRVDERRRLVEILRLSHVARQEPYV